jgi:hypothetical protein
MKQVVLSELTPSELVRHFADITLAQDVADRHGEYTKYNRLFTRMMEVARELGSREGDQRIQLLQLYTHPNMQVRTQAAILTLAVAPIEAQAQLRAIVDSKWFPQAAEAGFCLQGFERGEFKPL